jgi:hypothetical protein
MHLSALKEIKMKVVGLLSSQAPLCTEEIQYEMPSTPEASVELALESLEREEIITTNTSSQFILTEKAIKKLKK